MIDESVFDGFPALETARLLLGPFQPADAAEILRFFSCERSLRFVPRERLVDDQGAATKLGALTSAFAERNAIWWAFREASDGAFVGYGGLFDINREDRKAEIGYGLHPEFWGSGYATEAIAAIVGFAFDRLRLHRVYGLVDPGNGASIRVLEKLGFDLEGTLRDNAFARGRYWDHCVLAALR